MGVGESGLRIWAYENFFQAQIALDLSTISLDLCTGGISINWARFSFDLLNPGDTGFGMATYYDNQYTAGVTIDGTHDPEVGTDPVSWTQVSGSYGSMVQLRDFTVTSGDIQNYYLDNATYDDGDTGDHYSYGDSGIFIDNPSGTVLVELQEIFLDPGLGPVGETYLAYKENPLVITVDEQWYEEVYPVYIPLVLSNNP